MTFCMKLCYNFATNSRSFQQRKVFSDFVITAVKVDAFWQQWSHFAIGNGGEDRRCLAGHALRRSTVNVDGSRDDWTRTEHLEWLPLTNLDARGCHPFSGVNISSYKTPDTLQTLQNPVLLDWVYLKYYITRIWSESVKVFNKRNHIRGCSFCWCS